MFCFSPSLEHQDAAKNLQKLFSPSILSTGLNRSIQNLQRSFDSFIRFHPTPWPAPGLQLTPEIHYQSELWLPQAEINTAFQQFYRSSLNYQPIFASTPFADAASWADIIGHMPSLFFEDTINPATMLKRLQTDLELKKKFIFWSFMPQRYYGNNPNRYPDQTRFILNRLPNHEQKTGRLNFLDAACGDGIGTYLLAGELLKTGIAPNSFHIEGWTLDPLEAWSAAHASFPHDPCREASFRAIAQPVISSSADVSILFKQADLLKQPAASQTFDVIICNGLLGGPIINRLDEMHRIIKNMVAAIGTGGMLLAANCFHGGWKQKCPQEDLKALFKLNNLKVLEAGEGICGIKQGWNYLSSSSP